MNDSSLLSNLNKIRNLLSDPKKWTQNHYAIDSDGNAVDFFR